MNESVTKDEELLQAIRMWLQSRKEQQKSNVEKGVNVK